MEVYTEFQTDTKVRQYVAGIGCLHGLLSELAQSYEGGS